MILRFSFFLFYCVLAILTLFSKPLAHNEKEGLPIIKIRSGRISGIKLTSGIYSFKGIPFAAPPVGALRWREPQPVRPWAGDLKCDRFAASAAQAPPIPNPPWTGEFLPPSAPISEDCLYLNVWTQAEHPAEKRPVIVWIHGGSFTGGSGSVAIYDGEAMARKGIVFVTINYRTGIFGFLAHPALSAESPHHTSGNYGLLDQIAALQWVRENIAAFGGDPANVTIDGQSAGSCSVNALAASPLAKGLFQRMIAESGFFFAPNSLPELSAAEQEGLHTMNEKGAYTLAQMRALPVAALLRDELMRLPVVDGYVLPQQVEKIFEQDKQSPGDLLLGYNEGDEYIDSLKDAKTFRADAVKRYGSHSADFLKIYPATTDKEAYQTERHLSRDQTFAYQAYSWARLQTRHTKNRVWFYYFDHVPPGKPDLGAFHAAEIPYALHNLSFWNKPFSADDQQLSEVMSYYWANFARTGNPNSSGLPAWPVFLTSNTQVMHFGHVAKPISLPAKSAFKFFAP